MSDLNAGTTLVNTPSSAAGCSRERPQPYPGQPSDLDAIGCECFKDENTLPWQGDVIEHLDFHHVLPKQIKKALEM